MTPMILKLYLSGHSPRSRDAIESLRSLCEARLGDDYTLEVVDVVADPEAAEADNVIATPTLVRVSPAPVRRVIGDLSDEHKVAWSLGLPMERMDGEAS